MNANKWTALLASVVTTALLSTVSPKESFSCEPPLHRAQQPLGYGWQPSDTGAFRSYSFEPGISAPRMRMYSQPTTRLAPSRAGSARRSTDLIERKLRPNIGLWR